MNSENLQKNAEEIEFLSADEKRLSECIGSLEKISAPKDFNFRVKSKIAAGENKTFLSGNLQWIRYFLPVGASAFVLAFVFYGTNFFAPAQPSEEMAVTEPAKSEKARTIQPAEPPSNMTVAVSNTNQSDSLPVNSGVLPQSLPGNNEKVIFAADRAEIKKADLKKKDLPNQNSDDGSLSRVMSVTKAPEILAKGLDSNTNVAPPPQKPENLIETSKEEILKELGLEIVSEAGKLKVRSVQRNSVADRSNIRTGDIIESLDRQKTDANDNSASSDGIRKLTVSRDGKLISIELKLN